MPKPTESQARPITYAEEWKLRQSVDPRIWMRCLLSIDAGLSLSEIAALVRHNLDFQEGTLRVLITAKRHRPRTVPMTPRLARALWEQCGHTTPDTPVTQRAGIRIAADSAGKFMQKVQARTGLNFRFHDLRHTFSSRLDDIGASAFAVAELMGHSIPRVIIDGNKKPFYVTTRDYVHPTPEKLRELIMQMAEATAAALRSEAEKEK